MVTFVVITVVNENTTSGAKVKFVTIAIMKMGLAGRAKNFKRGIIWRFVKKLVIGRVVIDDFRRKMIY